MAVDPTSLFWLEGTRTRSPDQLSDGGMIEPTTIASSAVADYAPPGNQTAGIWAISASVSTAISGFEAPSKGGAKRIRLMNVGSVAINLLRQSALSVAANRILSADATHAIQPGELATLYYFPTLAKWLLGAPSAAPPPPTPVDVCITRTVSVSLAIAADTTCIQRRPLIAAGVGVTIEATGEWLIL